MPHFYKRLAAMVLMCALSLGAVRILPGFFPASTMGELHYTPVTASDHGAVLTIDGHPVTAEEYSMCFIDYANAWNNMLGSLGMSWSGVWTEEEFLEQIRTSTEQMFTERQAIIDLVDQYNLHLTRAQLDEALAIKQESIDSLGGRDAFLERLSEIGMTEDMFDNRLYTSYARDRVNAFLFGEGGEYQVPLEEIRAYVDENYLRAKHVLIYEDTENAEALAKEVAERAKNGEDFDSLIEAYGEDPGMQQEPDGYVFTEGEMVDEFYQGTRALEIGGVSDPVRSSFGWHVIQRLPIEDDFIEWNRDTFIGMMDVYSLEKLLAERTEAMEVTRSEELYNAIGLYNVQDYLAGAGAPGSADDGAADDGAVTPAPADDGAVDDGAGTLAPADDGAVDDGAGTLAPADDGAADDGAGTPAPADDGAAAPAPADPAA